MLRIIAGSFKGRLIKTPEGAKTRPTSSKVREAIFDILGKNIENLRFLDLYSGSGAVGIEALSRGASFALFVENDFDTAILLKDNLQALDLASRTQILQMPVENAFKKIGSLEKEFHVAFLDPPYNEVSWQKVLNLLFEPGILAENGSAILEHGSRMKPVLPDCCREMKSYKYGDSSLLFVKKAGGQ
jgi:16S rRNA (guanine966-N2)-methyltransferase